MEDELSPIQLRDKYAKEIEMDVRVDITNMFEKQLSLPYTRHKWLHRFSLARQALDEMIEKKDNFVHQAVNVNNPMGLSKGVIANKLESQKEYKDLQKRIKQQEELVTYLHDEVNKNLSQMHWDFKNLVAMQKAEEL